MLCTVMLVPKVCFFFLKMRRIGQEDSEQIDGRRRSVNRPPETLFHQPWQVTCVIDVRVCQDDRIQRLWIDGRFLPIPQTKFLKALKKAAVDENPLPGGFK